MSGCRPVTIITKCCLACSRPIFLTDKADDELEMTTVCHRPEGLEQLEAQTNFTKQELQILYRGFKNVIQILIAKDVHQSSSMPKVLFCTLDLLKSFCFPQECPSGVVNEETFKHIYAQFFPHGGKEQHFSFCLTLQWTLRCLLHVCCLCCRCKHVCALSIQRLRHCKQRLHQIQGKYTWFQQSSVFEDAFAVSCWQDAPWAVDCLMNAPLI